ncbi:MAG: 3'-5' exonuclease [bacterium]|nr:3'-5' exonuclease [bacterium]
MIVVDVETSGINPEKTSILSIGAIDFANPENQFYAECRIWANAEIEQAALNINGFTREEITNKEKTQKELIKAFLKWLESCEEHTFAGENPSFDRDFITATARREKEQWTATYRTIDLHTIAYIHMLKRGVLQLKNKRTGVKLDTILVYIGLPEEPKPHNALTGAKMEAEAFSRLIHGKNLLKEFEKYPIPKHLKN